MLTFKVHQEYQLDFIKDHVKKENLFLNEVYPHIIPLAVNNLQNAKTSVGTEETYRITRDVELTEIRASNKMSPSLTVINLLWEII